MPLGNDHAELCNCAMHSLIKSVSVLYGQQVEQNPIQFLILRTFSNKHVVLSERNSKEKYALFRASSYTSKLCRQLFRRCQRTREKNLLKGSKSSWILGAQVACYQSGEDIVLFTTEKAYTTKMSSFTEVLSFGKSFLSYSYSLFIPQRFIFTLLR